jgi:hypothetical protein
METFDTFEFRRPALAREYLSLLSANHGRPLALFAPRQVGKTFFLEHDLAPAAIQAGLLPVYVDFGLLQDDLLGAISRPLEAALSQPHTEKILLMLDEVQTLADTPEGVRLIANLRIVIESRRKDLCAILTGSSQTGLLRLMSTLGTPLVPFAQLIPFPNLDDDFLRALANHFNALLPEMTLEMAGLRAAFGKVGFKPASLKDVVKTMAIHGTTDFSQGFEIFLASDTQVATWMSVLRSLTSFDRGVLITIAQGQPPLNPQTLKALEVIPGAKPTVENVRASISRLKRAGILSIGTGPTIEDHLFADFLAKQHLRDRTT